MATTKSSSYFKVLLLLNLIIFSAVTAQQVFEEADDATHPQVEEDYRLYLEEHPHEM